jgi:ArsR family transcriptional regulator
VNYADLAEKCKALAHPVRLQILDMLRGGELCVCHIEAALNRRQAYVSQQLMVLRESGLVETRRDGLQVFYRLAEPGLRGWLETILESDFSSVERLAGCGCPLCSSVESIHEKEHVMLQVKVLGSGCANCKRLEAETRAALDEQGIAYTLEKVTEYADIAAYGLLSTPGLVMNEQVKSAGRIPKRDQIVMWARETESA